MTIHDYQVEHLGLRKHLHGPRGNLPAKRLVAAEQKLLTSLSARVKCSRNLRTTEGTIRKQAAILARKRDTLRDALVDDVHADFGKPVNVRFARAKIAAFYCVMEQPIDTVAVVLIVLRGVNSTLCCDRMRATR